MTETITALPNSGRGGSLTGLRRKIFDLMVNAGKPIGAYRLLDALKSDGKSVAPPTVYRALRFLQSQNLIDRIETLNAFVVSPNVGTESLHRSQFLICSECGRTEELACTDAVESLNKRAQASGFFWITRPVIELVGLCPDCGQSCRQHDDREVSASSSRS